MEEHPKFQHPHGRCVDRNHRRALVGELTAATRQLHVAVLRQTMAEGLPVNPAALAVVLSAHDERADQPLCFTEAHVQELLWVGIAEFCEEYGLTVPEGCREALHAAIAIGTAVGSLHPASEPTATLFAPFHSLV